MKTVAQMIDDVIRREGGYVDHPADKGGPTKYGITHDTLSRWYHKAVPIEMVKALTKETARAIYEARFYREPGIDKLPPSIQPFVFDAAVNHGPSQAIKFVQAACADHNPGPIDGIVGPRTIAAANAYANEFLNEMIYLREQFYRSIVGHKPSQAVFLAGWLNRLEEFRTDVA